MAIINEQTSTMAGFRKLGRHFQPPRYRTPALQDRIEEAWERFLVEHRDSLQEIPRDEAQFGDIFRYSRAWRVTKQADMILYR